jgi:putative holliday junction resolvase
MKTLSIDPGQKRLGVAISDPTGTIANPLTVIQHISRPIDAAVITQIALDQHAEQIVIGQALDDDGQPTPEGRRAARLADAIRQQTDLPVILWDESGTTQEAVRSRRQMGVSRQNRQGHLDKIAAALILQSYLDSHSKL